jgi:hypothetical protein
MKESSNIFELVLPNFIDKITERLNASGISIDEPIESEEQITRWSSLYNLFLAESIGNVDFTSIENLISSEGLSFVINHQRIWGYCLLLSKVHLVMLEDICSTVRIQLDQANVKKYVLAKLMGKAIRTYAEVITLCENGLPYGAISLTRNIFELSVIMRFIDQYNDIVAMEFLKAAEKPLDEQDKDDYGWARSSGQFGENGRITFRALREKCGMDNSRYTEIYAFLSKYAHASSQSTNLEVGTSTDNVFIGKTNFGIENPAINAALFISNMMPIFINHFGDRNMRLKVLFSFEWSNMIHDEYTKTSLILYSA